MDDLDRGKYPDMERRVGSRAALSLKISIRERGRSRRSAVLTDISPFGCCVGDSFLVSRQQAVWISLPGLESQAATIRWVQGGGAGFSFDQPLHAAVVARFMGHETVGEQIGSGRSGSALQSTEVPGSRREQILAGWAEPSERILAKKTSQPNGRSLLGLIRRGVSRSVDHRLEKRYPPPIGEAESVRVAENRTKILNVSGSGLQVEFGSPVEIGSRLAVSFDGFTGLSGQVVWAADGRAGLALPRDSIELIELSDMGTEQPSIN